MFISDQDPDFFTHPDPGSQKGTGPGSGSATLVKILLTDLVRGPDFVQCDLRLLVESLAQRRLLTVVWIHDHLLDTTANKTLECFKKTTQLWTLAS